MAVFLDLDRRSHVDIPRGHQRLLQWRLATVAASAVTLWIALGELDRLVSGAVTEKGVSRSAQSLQGLDAWGQRDSWGIWALLEPKSREQLTVLLRNFAVLDLVFAASYILLLGLFFREYVLPRLLLIALAACEAGELVLVLIGACFVRDGAVYGAGALLAVLSIVKWAAVGLLLISAFGYRRLRVRLKTGFVRAWRAVFFQRLSAAVLVLLAAMALLPIPGVSDQLPDAQRAWAAGGMGTVHWIFGSVAVLVVAMGLFILGRRRSELAYGLYYCRRKLHKARASRWWWVCGPAALLIATAAVAVAGGMDQPVDWRYWMFLTVPVILLGCSWVALRLRAFRNSVELPAGWRARMTGFLQFLAEVDPRDMELPPMHPEPEPRPHSVQRAVDVWRCGDLLAFSFLAMAGMALVRSFTAPVALGIVRADGLPVGPSLGFLILGAGTVVLSFFAGAVAVRWWWPRRPSDPRRRGPEQGTVHAVLHPPTTTNGGSRLSSKIALVAAVAVLGLLAFIPAWSTTGLGVPATAVLSVGSWAMLLGCLTIRLQEQRALPIFDMMGLRANPMLTLIALLMAIASINGGDSRIHAIRQTDGPGLAAERPDVEAHFKDWLQSSSACSPRQAPTAGPGVRPMVLVAVEGGGIRAAMWTVKAFAQLSNSPCGAKAVILSSGVSGGSLGLALTRLYPPDSSTNGGETEQMAIKVAGPEALAASTAGAVVGDLVAGAAGLMVPTAPDGTRDWFDRSGLMEAAWEKSASRLGEPWTADVKGPAGALILNSTASGIGCRLLISQLDLSRKLGSQSAEGGDPACRTTPGFPLSIDLLGQQAQCPLHLRWSTAAMLSARFPVIAPAGRVPYPDGKGCSATSFYQAIDGGYSEGSGLGTVADIWPELRQVVMEHNGLVDRRGAPPGQDDYVVPIFLSIQNSPGSDVIAPVPAAAGELAVPLVGINAKNLQSDASAWLQRLDSASNVCPRATASESDLALESLPSKPATTCTSAMSNVRGQLGNRGTVVAAPDSRPALDPPLGWTLSQLSLDEMTSAMERETCRGEVPADGRHACTDFASLLQLLRSAPKPT